MNTSPLYELLFDSDANPPTPRVPLTPANCKPLGEFAKEVRDAVQTAVEVIAALNSCARSQEIPTDVLESHVTLVIEDLHLFVRALDEFEDHSIRVAELSP